MPIGFKALEARYAIALAQPLRVISRIGTVRKSLESAPRLAHELTALQVIEAIQSAFEDRAVLPIIT